MIKKGFWFVLLIAAASSCLNEPDCYRLNNNIIAISFKKKEDGAASTVTFVSIKGEGALMQFAATGSKVYLPLNYFQNTSSFYFEQSTRTDTINLQYLAQAQYVSSDCGVRYVLSDLAIVDHTFDSVRLVTRVPKNNSSGNNIEIFF